MSDMSSKPGHLRRSICKLAGAALIAGAGSVSAAETLFEVGGPRDDAVAAGPGLPQLGVASQFTLTQSFANVGILFDFSCFGCTGTFYLSNGPLGPEASVLDYVAIVGLDEISGPETFSGLSLDPGTYSIILEISSGFALAYGTTAPTFTGVAGISDGNDFLLTELNPGIPLQSTFVPTSTLFSYSLTGPAQSDPGAVPEPDAWLLMLVGFGAMGAVLRTRRRRSPDLLTS